MDKIKLSLSEELMQFWLSGWPNYTLEPADDHRSVTQLHYKVSSILGLNPEDPDDFKRIGFAITNIATYCRFNYRWASRNIFYANMCFQTLKNEMQAKKRIEQINSQGYNYRK